MRTTLLALLCAAPLAGQMRITTRAEWQRFHSETLFNVEKVMGPLPRVKRPPLDIQVLSEKRLERYTLRSITFVSEILADGSADRVPAFVLIPQALAGRAPAMLCLHQTTRIGKSEPAGIGGFGNLHYAAELAARGYVTLAPDYPNFGDYRFDAYENGYASASRKGAWNHSRAVDVLLSMPEVDPARIGAIGHSLGGHNTLFAGLFDDRIRALVTSCGFTAFPKYYGGNLNGWSHRGYMPRIAGIYGKDPARMPFDFPDILIALAPRPVFINAPLHDANFEVSGVEDCVRQAQPVYDRVFGAAGRLVVRYPDAKHDFPPAIREEAYQFLDRWLASKR